MRGCLLQIGIINQMYTIDYEVSVSPLTIT